VIEPRKLFFLGCSTIAATHKSWETNHKSRRNENPEGFKIADVSSNALQSSFRASFLALMGRISAFGPLGDNRASFLTCTDSRRFFILALVEVHKKSGSESRPERAALFETTRRVIAILLTLGAFLILGVLFFALWQNRFDPVLTELVLRQFPVIIGLPFGALGAFIVVTLLRQREDPLEFEGLGFRLKGAAGEIILWNISFLVIVAAIVVKIAGEQGRYAVGHGASLGG